MSQAPSSPANALNDHQRARLMHSSRKLRQILGTTPYLVDSFSEQCDTVSNPPMPVVPANKPTSRDARRHGRIFSTSTSVSPSSSTSSLGSWQSVHVSDLHSASSPKSPLDSDCDIPNTPPLDEHRKAPSPIKISLPGLKTGPKLSSKQSNPLKLRLNPVPVSPSDTRYEILSPIIPPPTPLSPKSMVFNTTQSPPHTRADRRRKMAKLCRTLGENVPPELVFPKNVNRPREDSPLSASFKTENKTRLGRPPIPAFPPPTPVHPVLMPQTYRSADLLSAGTATVLHRGPFKMTRQSIAFQSIMTRCEPADCGVGAEHLVGQDYEGQWNLQDIGDVRRALRALKA